MYKNFQAKYLKLYRVITQHEKVFYTKFHHFGLYNCEVLRYGDFFLHSPSFVTKKIVSYVLKPMHMIIKYIS